MKSRERPFGNKGAAFTVGKGWHQGDEIHGRREKIVRGFDRMAAQKHEKSQNHRRIKSVPPQSATGA